MTTPSKIRLTQRAVDEALASHQRGVRERHWFIDHPGLYLQITPAGCASYCLRYERPGGGKGDYTIGQAGRVKPIEGARKESGESKVLGFGRITTDMAREAATARLAALTLHRTDPCEARRAAHSEARTRRTKTFAALAADFMAASENRQLAKRTFEDRDLILKNYVLPRLGQHAIDGLSRSAIKECIREIQAQVRQKVDDPDDHKAGNRTANKVHSFIHRVFSWAIDEERCEVNPAAFRKIFDDHPAKRIAALNDERVRTIWLALDQEVAKPKGKLSALGLQLCFLTLQRPNEIANAHRDDFDFDASLWRVPESRTKTNTLYQIPLTDYSSALFREAFATSKSKWAFPAEVGEGNMRPNVLSNRFVNVRRKLVAASKLPSNDIQLYDARRFGRTRLVQALGFQEHVAEQVINHAPDRSMARRYDVADYSGDTKRAHEAWSLEIRRIVYQETPPSNVVPIVARQAAE